MNDKCADAIIRCLMVHNAVPVLSLAVMSVICTQLTQTHRSLVLKARHRAGGRRHKEMTITQVRSLVSEALRRALRGDLNAAQVKAIKELASLYVDVLKVSPAAPDQPNQILADIAESLKIPPADSGKKPEMIHGSNCACQQCRQERLGKAQAEAEQQVRRLRGEEIPVRLT